MIAEAGVYRVKPVGAEPGYSSGGTPQVAVRFEGEAGSITGYFYLSEKAAKRSGDALRAAGWTGDDAFTFDGRECDIVVRCEEYQGRMVPKVAFVNAAGSSPQHTGKPMDQSAKASFAAKLRALSGTAAPLPPKPDGDVPF